MWRSEDNLGELVLCLHYVNPQFTHTHLHVHEYKWIQINNNFFFLQSSIVSQWGGCWQRKIGIWIYFSLHHRYGPANSTLFREQSWKATQKGLKSLLSFPFRKQGMVAVPVILALRRWRRTSSGLCNESGTSLTQNLLNQPTNQTNKNNFSFQSLVQKQVRPCVWGGTQMDTTRHHTDRRHMARWDMGLWEDPVPCSVRCWVEHGSVLEILREHRYLFWGSSRTMTLLGVDSESRHQTIQSTSVAFPSDIFCLGDTCLRLLQHPMEKCHCHCLFLPSSLLPSLPSSRLVCMCESVVCVPWMRMDMPVCT